MVLLNTLVRSTIQLIILLLRKQACMISSIVKMTQITQRFYHLSNHQYLLSTLYNNSNPARSTSLSPMKAIPTFTHQLLVQTPNESLKLSWGSLPIFTKSKFKNRTMQVEVLKWFIYKNTSLIWFLFFQATWAKKNCQDHPLILICQGEAIAFEPSGRQSHTYMHACLQVNNVKVSIILKIISSCLPTKFKQTKQPDEAPAISCKQLETQQGTPPSET